VRNLIKDSNGDPTTITVTANDQLTIIWRLKKHFPGSTAMLAAKTTTPITLNGVLTNVTFKQLNPYLNSTYAPNTILSPIPRSFSISYHGRMITESVENMLLVNAEAGDSFIQTTQNVGPYEAVKAGVVGYSNPVPGVLRTTETVSWGLDGNYSATEATKGIFARGVHIRLSAMNYVITFDPEFIVGPDKTLSYTVFYDVTRA
jgi:hypothetical protein